MKKINILLIPMFAVSLFNCYVIPDNPFSARLQCYKKNYCDTAVNDCIIGSALFGALFTPSSASSTTTTTASSTTPVENLTNYSKSGTSSSSTFSSTQGYTSTSNSTLTTPYNSATYSTSTPMYENMNITGTLNNPNNIDIMRISYTSSGYTAGSTQSYSCIGYTGNTRIVEVTKISGAATCQLYSQFGASSNSTNTPTSETLLGTLFSTANTITFNLASGPTFLYVRCSGVLNDQYAIKFAYSSLNKANEVFPCTTTASSSSSSSNSFSNNFLSFLTSPLTCVDADKTCKSDCDKKNFY